MSRGRANPLANGQPRLGGTLRDLSLQVSSKALVKEILSIDLIAEKAQEVFMGPTHWNAPPSLIAFSKFIAADLDVYDKVLFPHSLQDLIKYDQEIWHRMPILYSLVTKEGFDRNDYLSKWKEENWLEFFRYGNYLLTDHVINKLSPTEQDGVKAHLRKFINELPDNGWEFNAQRVRLLYWLKLFNHKEIIELVQNDKTMPVALEAICLSANSRKQKLQGPVAEGLLNHPNASHAVIHRIVSEYAYNPMIQNSREILPQICQVVSNIPDGSNKTINSSLLAEALIRQNFEPVNGLANSDKKRIPRDNFFKLLSSDIAPDYSWESGGCEPLINLALNGTIKIDGTMVTIDITLDEREKLATYLLKSESRMSRNENYHLKMLVNM